MLMVTQYCTLKLYTSRLTAKHDVMPKPPIDLQTDQIIEFILHLQCLPKRGSADMWGYIIMLCACEYLFELRLG